MNEHTKGKLIIMDGFGQSLTDDPRYFLIIFGSKTGFNTVGGNDKANAERLFKVWNNFDSVEQHRNALRDACRMVHNSIFQDNEGEWQLNRPAELLKTITEEALAGVK